MDPSRTSVENIRRVILTDEVLRTLFAEFAEHKASERGEEEIGWVLLGRREADQAIVLATLPAEANRDAGEAHIWIAGHAHVVGSWIVRQLDRRLTVLGVVHTHPGRLRHPSAGDFDSDRVWVGNLRGKNRGAVFGIGTAEESHGRAPEAIGGHPKPHVQSFGGMRFDWYTLTDGDANYHAVPVELAIGSDVALPLRGVWAEVEEYAERLDRITRQFARVRIEVVSGRVRSALSVEVDLTEPGHRVRVVLEGKSVRFFYEADGQVFQPDLPADIFPDQGIFLLLAELAARG